MQPTIRFFVQIVLRTFLLISIFGGFPLTVVGQGTPEKTAASSNAPAASVKEDLATAPVNVDVKPVAEDDEIRKRLQSVLEATNWFIDPQVEVKEGVVFLNGRVDSAELKKWAGDLARNTQDVVAVVNRMEVLERSMWDLRPAWSGLFLLWREFIGSIPFFVFGLLILALAVGGGILTTRATRSFLIQRIPPKLLRNVIARGAGVLVFLFGAYIVLRVSGLTQLALTIVGGTGLIGLAVGIAFRDITENFLASIFLSMQRPFQTGDLVEINGLTGYVQQLNIRTTILMSLDGTFLQIPNATVYKSNLRNFTTNSNRREDFIIGIGYDDSINDAQEIARQVLADHPAVLNDPEPLVLADNLGKSTINLRVYFWLNGSEHSWLKVRSSVIRLVKLAFQKYGISMPDEAREIVFPQGVPVTVLEEKMAEESRAVPGKHLPTGAPEDAKETVSTKAEAGLYSEAAIIEQQARKVQPMKEEENLLQSASDPPSAEKKR